MTADRLVLIDRLVEAKERWSITVEGGDAAAGGDESAAVECVLVLQQERANLGVVSLTVYVSSQTVCLSVLVVTDRLSVGPMLTQRLCFQKTDDSRGNSNGLDNGNNEVIGKAAWTWRRGALYVPKQSAVACGLWV